MRYIEKEITGYATGYNSSGSYSSSYPWSNISNAFDWSSTVSPTQTGTSYWRGTYATIKIYQYSNKVTNGKNFLKGIKNYKCCLNEDFEDAYDGTGTEYLNFSCIPSDSEITQFKFKVRSSIGKYHDEAVRYFKNSKDVTTNGSNSEENFVSYKTASSSGIAVTENMNYNNANTDGHVFIKNSSGNFVYSHMNYHIGKWTISDFKNGYFLPQVFWGASSSSAGTNYCYPRGFSLTLSVKIPVYTIETSFTGQGIVSGGGEYISEKSVTLTATPSFGYVFKQWSDGDKNQTRTVVSSSDITYTAIFEPITYIISTNTQPVEGGTISGGGTYNQGTSITLTAKPNSGYKFLHWDDNTINPSRNLIVNSNATYTAYFDAINTNNLCTGQNNIKSVMLGNQQMSIFIGNAQLY